MYTSIQSFFCLFRWNCYSWKWTQKQYIDCIHKSPLKPSHMVVDHYNSVWKVHIWYLQGLNNGFIDTTQLSLLHSKVIYKYKQYIQYHNTCFLGFKKAWDWNDFFVKIIPFFGLLLSLVKSLHPIKIIKFKNILWRVTNFFSYEHKNHK